MKNNLFISLFILFGLSSCWYKPVEPKQTLPEITQSGKHTFGCYLNGEIWNRGVPIGLSAVQYLLAMQYDGMFQIYALGRSSNSKINTKYGTLEIFLQHPVQIGKIYLNDSLHYAQFSYEKPPNDIILYKNVSNSSYVEITKYDTINKIYSGLFAIDITNDDGEIISMKDGRFDIDGYK